MANEGGKVLEGAYYADIVLNLPIFLVCFCDRFRPTNSLLSLQGRLSLELDTLKILLRRTTFRYEELRKSNIKSHALKLTLLFIQNP